MPRYAVILILVLILAGCSARTQDGPVLDLTTLVQDTSLYHGLPPETPLLSDKAQRTAYAYFLTRHFGPWHRKSAKHTAEEVFWGLTSYKDTPLFGENTLQRDPSWLDAMAANSRVNAYPSMGRRAITVTNTSLRTLPTRKPAFFDFKRAGEGFPFDYMQNSLVLAGTPLFATHSSADGEWILVESRHAFGWVEARDIGWVDNTTAKTFETGSYGAVSTDNVPIFDRDGGFCFMGEVGMLLPFKGRDILIPIRDATGNALLAVGKLPETAINPAPIPTTPANFSRVANTMLGRPYGWGGLYGNRDCSATTMDLMAAFGLYLPRNSSQQIQKGTLVDLTDLSREKKKQRILEQGTPFLTLVRKPGHIMLYIGSYNGQPLVMHSAWGLKTKVDGVYGRKVMGSTIITTLEPGIELKTLARPGGDYLESVQAISTLP